MTIREQEDALFLEWANGNEHFVPDGVADQTQYLNSKRKLLFVLKEVNDPDGGGWDLRDFIRAGGRSQTWTNITRWVEGIRSLPDDKLWSDLEEISEQRRAMVLPSIAVMNLKKLPGGTVTDTAALAQAATENANREFLRRQFALYDPDITICCGAITNGWFHDIVSFEQGPRWQMTRRGVPFHAYRNKKFVISYSHPQARVSSHLLHYGLIDSIREILDDRGF